MVKGSSFIAGKVNYAMKMCLEYLDSRITPNIVPHRSRFFLKRFLSASNDRCSYIYRPTRAPRFRFQALFPPSVITNCVSRQSSSDIVTARLSSSKVAPRFHLSRLVKRSNRSNSSVSNYHRRLHCLVSRWLSLLWTSIWRPS